jgi:hypothetical protein
MVSKSRFFLSGRAEPFYQKIHLRLISETYSLFRPFFTIQTGIPKNVSLNDTDFAIPQRKLHL